MILMWMLKLFRAFFVTQMSARRKRTTFCRTRREPKLGWTNSPRCWIHLRRRGVLNGPEISEECGQACGVGEFCGSFAVGKVGQSSNPRINSGGPVAQSG